MGLKWAIGEVEIFQIVELEAGELIQSIIEDATPSNIRDIAWLYPYFADKTGSLKASVQGFLIKTPRLWYMATNNAGFLKLSSTIQAAL